MSSPPSPKSIHPHYDSVENPPPLSAPGVPPTNWLTESQNRMARRSMEDETRPLLKKPSSDTTSQKLSDVEMVKDEIEEHRSLVLKAEFIKILKMSGPVIFTYMLQNSLQTGSILVVGRMGPEELAIAAFSYMAAMSTGWLIALGGTTAVDTLGSQVYASGIDPQGLGVILQRGYIILTLFYIPIGVLFWFSKPVFLALGQEEFISEWSCKFLRLLIPGGLGYIYFETTKKYLQAQGIMHASSYVLLITSPINVVLNYVFVYTFKFGVLGAPAATGITYWLSFLGLVLYARFVDGRKPWGGWSKRAFRGWGIFSQLALLGFLMVGTEWLAFEIITIEAGKLGTIPLAAQSVIATSDQLFNTIPFGLGVAASNRVGNLLGARKASRGATAAFVAAWTSVLFGGIIMAALLIVKSQYGKLFSDDQDVIDLVSEVMPFVAAFQIADGLAQANSGCLRGMGRQHIGACVNLVAYYLMALPVGIYLAFHGWGLSGLWAGNAGALFIVGFLQWGIVFFTNWENQVKIAYGRIEQDHRIEEAAIRAAENGI